MDHPLRPSAAPCKGASPDTEGPVVLSCLGRACSSGAAGKARWRTGFSRIRGCRSSSLVRAGSGGVAFQGLPV